MIYGVPSPLFALVSILTAPPSRRQLDKFYEYCAVCADDAILGRHKGVSSQHVAAHS